MVDKAEERAVQEAMKKATGKAKKSEDGGMATPYGVVDLSADSMIGKKYDLGDKIGEDKKPERGGNPEAARKFVEIYKDKWEEKVKCYVPASEDEWPITVCHNGDLIMVARGKVNNIKAKHAYILLQSNYGAAILG